MAPGLGASTSSSAGAPSLLQTGGLHRVATRTGPHAAGSGAVGAALLASERSPEAGASDADNGAVGAATPSADATQLMPNVQDRPGSGEPWTDCERLTHIACLGIVQLPEEEQALGFLFEALRRSRLPESWQLFRDSAGRAYFADSLTGRSSWTHPLEPTLRELADVYRLCADTAADLRELAVASLLATWEEEANHEMEPWQPKVDAEGVKVFVHRDTSEELRVDPSDVFLPRLFMKSSAVERLRQDNYVVDASHVRKIILDERTQKSAVTEAGPPVADATGSPLGLLPPEESGLLPSTAEFAGMAPDRRERALVDARLELAQLEKDNLAMEIAKVEAELRISQARAKGSMETVQAMEREVALERQKGEAVEAEMQTYMSSLQGTLLRWKYSQASMASMQVRLAALKQDEAAKEQVLQGLPSELAAALDHIYQEEASRRALVLTASDGGAPDLPGRLREAAVEEEALMRQLSAKQQELRTAKLLKDDFEQYAERCRAALERERSLLALIPVPDNADLEMRLAVAQKELEEQRSLRLPSYEQVEGPSAESLLQVREQLKLVADAQEADRALAERAEAQVLAERKSLEHAMQQRTVAEALSTTLRTKLVTVFQGLQKSSTGIVELARPRTPPLADADAAGGGRAPVAVKKPVEGSSPAALEKLYASIAQDHSRQRRLCSELNQANSQRIALEAELARLTASSEIAWERVSAAQEALWTAQADGGAEGSGAGEPPLEGDPARRLQEELGQLRAASESAGKRTELARAELAELQAQGLPQRLKAMEEAQQSQAADEHDVRDSAGNHYVSQDVDGWDRLASATNAATTTATPTEADTAAATAAASVAAPEAKEEDADVASAAAAPTEAAAAPASAAVIAVAGANAGDKLATAAAEPTEAATAAAATHAAKEVDSGDQLATAAVAPAEAAAASGNRVVDAGATPAATKEAGLREQPASTVATAAATASAAASIAFAADAAAATAAAAQSTAAAAMATAAAAAEFRRDLQKRVDEAVAAQVSLQAEADAVRKELAEVEAASSRLSAEAAESAEALEAERAALSAATERIAEHGQDPRRESRSPSAAGGSPAELLERKILEVAAARELIRHEVLAAEGRRSAAREFNDELGARIGHTESALRDCASRRSFAEAALKDAREAEDANARKCAALQEALAAERLRLDVVEKEAQKAQSEAAQAAALDASLAAAQRRVASAEAELAEHQEQSSRTNAAVAARREAVDRDKREAAELESALGELQAQLSQAQQDHASALVRLREATAAQELAAERMRSQAAERRLVLEQAVAQAEGELREACGSTSGALAQVGHAEAELQEQRHTAALAQSQLEDALGRVEESLAEQRRLREAAEKRLAEQRRRRAEQAGTTQEAAPAQAEESSAALADAGPSGDDALEAAREEVGAVQEATRSLAELAAKTEALLQAEAGDVAASERLAAVEAELEAEKERGRAVEEELLGFAAHIQQCLDERRESSKDARQQAASLQRALEEVQEHTAQLQGATEELRSALAAAQESRERAEGAEARAAEERTRCEDAARRSLAVERQTDELKARLAQLESEAEGRRQHEQLLQQQQEQVLHRLSPAASDDRPNLHSSTEVPSLRCSLLESSLLAKRVIREQLSAKGAALSSEGDVLAKRLQTLEDAERSRGRVQPEQLEAVPFSHYGVVDALQADLQEERERAGRLEAARADLKDRLEASDASRAPLLAELAAAEHELQAAKEDNAGVEARADQAEAELRAARARAEQAGRNVEEAVLLTQSLTASVAEVERELEKMQESTACTAQQAQLTEAERPSIELAAERAKELVAAFESAQAGDAEAARLEEERAKELERALASARRGTCQLRGEVEQLDVGRRASEERLQAAASGGSALQEELHLVQDQLQAAAAAAAASKAEADSAQVQLEAAQGEFTASLLHRASLVKKQAEQLWLQQRLEELCTLPATAAYQQKQEGSASASRPARQARRAAASQKTKQDGSSRLADGSSQAVSDRSGWEAGAAKLFHKLDRRGAGRVDTGSVLQIWPLLSRHAEADAAAALAAHLISSKMPLNTQDWMELMGALDILIGPKRFNRNVHALLASTSQHAAQSTPSQSRAGRAE